jgi:hypothetical protein
MIIYNIQFISMSCRREVLEEGDYIDDFYDMLIFRINFFIKCFISER